MKLFISSTYNDLKDYRQVAIEVANRYECAPLAVEIFMAQPEEPFACNCFIHEEHLHKAKEYALEVSEYAHLYQSQDPHFYGGIPEAAMLKRGMTEQERIDNGYWVAYKIAEAMEQRAKD